MQYHTISCNIIHHTISYIIQYHTIRTWSLRGNMLCLLMPCPSLRPSLRPCNVDLFSAFFIMRALSRQANHVLEFPSFSISPWSLVSALSPLSSWDAPSCVDADADACCEMQRDSLPATTTESDIRSLQISCHSCSLTISISITCINGRHFRSQQARHFTELSGRHYPCCDIQSRLSVHYYNKSVIQLTCSLHAAHLPSGISVSMSAPLSIKSATTFPFPFPFPFPFHFH